MSQKIAEAEGAGSARDDQPSICINQKFAGHYYQAGIGGTLARAPLKGRAPATADAKNY